MGRRGGAGLVNWEKAERAGKALIGVEPSYSPLWREHQSACVGLVIHLALDSASKENLCSQALGLWQSGPKSSLKFTCMYKC